MFEAQPLGGEYVSNVRIMMEVLCFDVKEAETQPRRVAVRVILGESDQQESQRPAPVLVMQHSQHSRPLPDFMALLTAEIRNMNGLCDPETSTGDVLKMCLDFA